MLKRHFFLPALVVSLLLLLTGCTQPPYTNVDNRQLQQLLQDGVPLYDIRRPDEWRQTGVIEGSHKLSFVSQNGQVYPDFFPTFQQQVKPDQAVIIFCRTGNRSAYLAQHLMEKMGYTKVYNAKQGMVQWRQEGLPVVAP
ncbi:Rhodanese domain protein [Magnetococcus marinus MC-1]|uniref:Rhodanese domain protein n=1 Tax=Magnetococcus marinus (strain ATCC BAA-1437 / JCM 17883 / MC-1) TaxID=156889 RepID=A0LAM2_MAGMM|nr:rhodanese-like domain-containing protein [Magnetococcus marinus]ABK45015.1 Rhodanese domain protein [Magnetococcus marinus MC-1]